jgi:NodT family efflux transporter outer membrane factor (OMF) lipoprotein
MKRLLLFAATAALAACSSVPREADLRAPNASWAEAETRDSEIVDTWWRAFDDPILDAIVARVEQGDDIALASARLDEAVAGLKRARAALLPDIAVQGAGALQKSGDQTARRDSADGGLAASWSPDLFGQTRLRASAAARRAKASEADLAAARLDARSAAARLYFAIRSAQGQAEAAESNVASLTETLALVDARAAAGLAPQFDVAQARAALAAATARPPALRQAEISARLALEALIGAPAGSLKPVLGAAAPLTTPKSDAALAPASVLARRPDLQSAELLFAAAGYDARAARRDFWPRVTLSGLVGGQSVSPETFVSGSGALYNAAAAAAAPVFSFGRLEAARDGADARLQQAMIAYRRAATYALADVERALAARKDAAARQAALTTAREAARDQAGLARERYVAGLSPLLDVLVAERASFDAEAALAIADADAASAYADLSAAMGLGGAPSIQQMALRVETR